MTVTRKQCGSERQVFSVGPLRFDVVVCHEGWCYPETVRWAARREVHSRPCAGRRFRWPGQPRDWRHRARAQRLRREAFGRERARRPLHRAKNVHISGT